MKQLWKIVTVFFAMAGMSGQVQAISWVMTTNGDKMDAFIWADTGAVAKGMGYAAKMRWLKDRDFGITIHPTPGAVAAEGELHGVENLLLWGPGAGVMTADVPDQNISAWNLVKPGANGDAHLDFVPYVWDTKVHGKKKQGVFMATFPTWGAVVAHGEMHELKGHIVGESAFKAVATGVWDPTISESNLVKPGTNGDAHLDFVPYAWDTKVHRKKKHGVLMATFPTWGAVASHLEMHGLKGHIAGGSAFKAVATGVWDPTISEAKLVKVGANGDTHLNFVSYVRDGRPSGPMGIDSEMMRSIIADGSHVAVATH